MRNKAKKAVSKAMKEEAVEAFALLKLPKCVVYECNMIEN